MKNERMYEIPWRKDSTWASNFKDIRKHEDVHFYTLSGYGKGGES